MAIFNFLKVLHMKTISSESIKDLEKRLSEITEMQRLLGRDNVGRRVLQEARGAHPSNRQDRGRVYQTPVTEAG